MAASKCGNCGADIPDNATFCPGCGAPKAAGQQTPVAQPAPMKSGGAGFQGIIDTFLSRTMILIGLFVGVLIAWILRIIGQFYAHVAITIAYITFMTGVGGLLICGGFLNKNINVYIRAALIAVGGIIIAIHL